MVAIDRFPRVAQHKSAVLPTAQRRSSFAEVRRGLGGRPEGDAVSAEAARCLSCGACNACETCVAYCPEGVLRCTGEHACAFDYDYCKGCGLCAAQCPRGAIVMQSGRRGGGHMTRAYVTGNHAAGYALVAAGEANRGARGCCSGVYPITPQTEIIEYLTAAKFAKGDVVPVESEHSAMGVCIGASIDGARAFTASSSNGLLYMTENVFAAGYYRLPIVMVASNRTLGPPWNIWVDQGDTLALRDAAWLQMYCESHQELVDTILLAFRVAEDPRILLPVIVAQDGFILSHTQMVVSLPRAGARRPLSSGPQLASSHGLRASANIWRHDLAARHAEAARGHPGRHGPSADGAHGGDRRVRGDLRAPPARGVLRRAHRRCRHHPGRQQHDGSHGPARGRGPPGSRGEGRACEGEALPPLPPGGIHASPRFRPSRGCP